MNFNRLSLGLLVVLALGLHRTEAFFTPTHIKTHQSSLASHPVKPSSSKLNSFALDGAGAVVNSFLESQPYLAAFLTCSFKASAADLVAQTKLAATDDKSLSSEETKHFDLSRNLAFLFYGGLWQGMFQQFLFTTIYPSIFGVDHSSMAAVAPQVAFDTLFMGPCVFLPVCYTVKSFFASANDGFSWDTVQSGLTKYRDDVTQAGLLQLFWSMWIPAQFLTFGVMPPHLRVIFVAMVSFFWVCALSTISSSSTQPDAETIFPAVASVSRPARLESKS